MSRRSARVSEKNARVVKEQAFLARVTSPIEDGLQVIHAGDKGRGVAATKVFHVGDYVAKYQGELISHKEALNR